MSEFEKLTYKEQGKIKEYYRCVLRKGLLKEKGILLEKKHRRLINWIVEKKLTIYDLPASIFQPIQRELIGVATTGPL